MTQCGSQLRWDFGHGAPRQAQHYELTRVRATAVDICFGIVALLTAACVPDEDSPAGHDAAAVDVGTAAGVADGAQRIVDGASRDVADSPDGTDRVVDGVSRVGVDSPVAVETRDVAAPDGPAPDRAASDANSASQKGLCRKDGWCWYNPLPQGERLEAVWASSRSDAWAVGPLALHWNGSVWSAVETGTVSTLRAIWGTAADDVWAAGDGGTILHWNGSAWAAVQSGMTQAIYAIWGAAADDVWAVGGAGGYSYASRATPGVILHWNGSKWSSSPAATTLFSVWGTSANDVWAGGDKVVLRWNGATWSAAPNPSMGLGVATGIWGSSANDVWLASDDNFFHHWNGTGWEAVTLPQWAAGSSPWKLWGSSASDVWAVKDWFSNNPFLHFDGAKWSSVLPDTPYGFNGIWGTAGDDIWAVGNGGAIHHWNGSAWTASSKDVIVDRAIFEQLLAVWGSSADDVWAGGSVGRIVHWNGQAWSPIRASGHEVRSIWGRSATDVWFVGGDGISHWDGSAVSSVKRYTAAGTLTDVWGSSASDVWVVSIGGAILHWNGALWSETRVSGDLFGVWGSSANDVWAVGQGVTYRWNGSQWTSIKHPDYGLFGIWGRSPSDVWAVGSSGSLIIAHWSGTNWSTVFTGETATSPIRIWAASANDIWLTNSRGAAIHGDGKSWSRVEIRASSIWGSSSADLWAVSGGMILRRQSPLSLP